MRTLLLLAVIALASSGCFSPPSSTPTTSHSASRTETATKAPAPVLPTTTDTLHLLAAPGFSMVGPTGSSDIVAAVPSPFDSSGASNSAAGKSPYLIWTFTLPGDLSVLMANMTLWVDVEGTVVGDPFPTANGCFWNAMIQVHQDPQSLPGQLAPPSALTSTCGVEPLQVPTGIRALQLKFPVAQGTLAKGTQLDLALNSNAFASPAAHVDMLTGSTVHDSQISLQGLQMPLDPEGLLGAMGPPA